MPNIWGDLELTTIFPIRERNMSNRLKKFDKPLQEITRENFAFDYGVYRRVEVLREDCRPLHAEPLQSGAELPRQAVVQKGLSTFHKAFTLSSLADGHLKSHPNPEIEILPPQESSKTPATFTCFALSPRTQQIKNA
jgi:hypothetical protein